jgi:hypothetical protein
MGLSAHSVQRGTTPSSDGHLPKSELVGELIAFSVVDYDPKSIGKFGVQPSVEVDLLVVTGPHAGTHDPSWKTFGNLAKQLGSQQAGATIAARVTSGPGATAGSTWYGADFDLSDAELRQVREAILAIGEPESVSDPVPF